MNALRKLFKGATQKIGLLRTKLFNSQPRPAEAAAANTGQARGEALSIPVPTKRPRRPRSRIPATKKTRRWMRKHSQNVNRRKRNPKKLLWGKGHWHSKHAWQPKPAPPFLRAA